MDITYDKYSLMVDGKRLFIKSGAFHYFRTPGEKMARDRFSKMKSGGYNTVDIYFNWNYHSKAPGVYDFSGIKDVRKVLQAAKDTGLFVIARPGPFINAEVNAGGLPFWLLKAENVIPRNRVGTAYQYSKKYMEYVAEWYDQIIPVINEFDNVILFQIENEYATDTMEEDYMRELYKMARERGIKCPIFHNDAYFAGLWADCVDIYALDLYPYINPNQNWKQDNFCFDTLDNVEDIFRSAKEDSPPFIAEMQAGWFDKWDGSGYEHIRKALGDEHINIMTKTALSQGVTLFNHYMTVGGTNWDDLACDEVYTSYEFAAPIDEFGALQSNFYKAKEINYLIDSFGFTCTEPKDFDFYQENIYAKLRHDLVNDCDWLFLRNLNSDTAEIKLPSGKDVKLKSYDMKICPLNLQLKGCKIDFSDVEIFARLNNEKEEAIFFIADENANIYLSDGKIISGNQKDYVKFTFGADDKKTQFIFLTRELANKSWCLGDKMIFNADYVLPNGAVAVDKSSEIAYFDLTYKFNKKNCIVDKFNGEQKIQKLEIKKVEFCSPEIDVDYDYSDWKKVSSDTDAFSCDMYDEFVWYKTKIPDNLSEITLSARHLFAVYINGKEVLNRNSYKLEKLQEVPETISIPLNNSILSAKVNELTILVQNLGFDKGFSGDTNNPRGLVLIKTNPEIPLEFSVCEKLALERTDKYESENPYLAKITAEFDIDFNDDVFLAKYISFEDFRCRRATIFLNGVKIGRYIKRRNVQDKFYLVSEFLKPHNKLEVVVWEKERNIKSPWGFKSDLKNVIILLGTFKICQLFK
ncbi:MAG: beta-galactosidase [Candidatus Gastranaerophilaceae bacterium]|nr:beta-galactosidase [Candidatus Gastranaerophilaceae bacterium]